MKNQPFFPQRQKSKPIIYEVGYTKRAIEERMKVVNLLFIILLPMFLDFLYVGKCFLEVI